MGALSLALIAAACGSSGTKASDTGSKETTTTKPAATTTTKPARCDWKFNTVGFWKRNPPAKFAKGITHMGNNHGVQPWEPLTDTAKCDELQGSIDKMNEVVAKFPTAQDALDFGCYRATVFVKGIAAHYVCVKNYSPTANVEKPIMLLYGGSDPTAPIVGLSYMVFTEKSPNELTDLPLWTKYMPFHYHEGLCTNKAGLVIGGDHSDKKTCEAAGGKLGGNTGWMGHYWLQNCPSPDGVFSADNPRLDWDVAKFNDDPTNAKNTAALVKAPCQGTKVTIEPTGNDAFGQPTGTTPSTGEHDMSHEGDHPGEGNETEHAG